MSSSSNIRRKLSRSATDIVLPLKLFGTVDSGRKWPVAGVFPSDGLGTTISRRGVEDLVGGASINSGNFEKGLSDWGLGEDWVFADRASLVLDSSTFRFWMNGRGVVLNWTR